MVDLLTLLTICAFEKMWKMCRFFWMTGIVFLKAMLWLITIGALDIVLIPLTLALYLLGKIFRKRTPKLKHTPKLLFYPSWEY